MSTPSQPRACHLGTNYRRGRASGTQGDVNARLVDQDGIHNAPNRCEGRGFMQDSRESCLPAMYAPLAIKGRECSQRVVTYPGNAATLPGCPGRGKRSYPTR